MNLPMPESIHQEFKNLKEQLIDMYGDGQLSESQFKPAAERAKMYLERNITPFSNHENGKTEVLGTLRPATS